MSMQWYGELPDRWETRIIKNLFHIQKAIAGEEGYNVLSITQRGIKIKDIKSNQGQMAQNYAKYQFVDIGDFAMNHMDLLTGWVDYSKVFGVTSPDYRVFVLDDKAQSSDYLLKALQLCYSQKVFYVLGHGAASEGRWRLPRKEFLNFPLPLPPREEQDQIVRYLDWKVSQINKLINVKRRQIALLGEQRRKAIDDTISSTDGEQHRFRHLFSLSKGLSITKADLKDKGIPCVSYGEVHSKYGFEVDPAVNSLKYVDDSYLASSPKSLLQYGDFVFVDTSEDIVGSGNFTYLNSDIKTFAGYHTIIARANRPLKHRYIAYYFDSSHYRSQIQQEVNGVKVYSITRMILNNTYIHLPDEIEQEHAVAVLDKQCSHIDRAIALLHEELGLFAEYRTRLISDVVTGKLDVRGVVVPEYEAVEDAVDNEETDVMEETEAE